MNYEKHCYGCLRHLQDGERVLEINGLMLVCSDCAVVREYEEPTSKRQDL